MASIVANLRNNTAIKGAAGFLQWWRDALIDTLPVDWRARLMPQPLRLLARVVADEVVLQRDDNGGEELGRFALGDDIEVSKQRILSAVGQFDEAPHNWLLLDGNTALRRTITVPQAAEENLRAVLGFEMDRYTPFTADQVCYDYRIIDRTGDNLLVELIVVRREQVDELVQQVTQRGIDLDGVDVALNTASVQQDTLGVNLLAPERRYRQNNKRLLWNLLLAALMIGLLYLAMWQSLQARERAIEQLQLRVNATRVQANQVSEMRESLTKSQDGALFLLDLKQTHPTMTRLLDAVTRTLPDDTSLQRLQINRERIELNGEAPEPARLIALLEEMDCIRQPAPKSAYTPNTKTGKERFVISSDLDCADAAAVAASVDEGATL